MPAAKNVLQIIPFEYFGKLSCPLISNWQSGNCEKTTLYVRVKHLND